MNSRAVPPQESEQGYWAWFGFWAQFFVLGALALLGLFVAGRGDDPGDYATGMLLAAGAILLAFLRLKSWFDGTSGDWTGFLLVEKPAHLLVVIPLFSLIALAGLIVGAHNPGTLQNAGVALFIACGLMIFLSLKRVFDKLDSQR